MPFLVQKIKDLEKLLNEEEQLDEKKKAKKKKKDPTIGKPKRGGSKAYYVYVRDPKTKRIKKVSLDQWFKLKLEILKHVKHLLLDINALKKQIEQNHHIGLVDYLGTQVN